MRSLPALAHLATAAFVRSILAIERKFRVGDADGGEPRPRLSRCRQLWLRIYRSRGGMADGRRDGERIKRGSVDHWQTPRFSNPSSFKSSDQGRYETDRRRRP